MFDSGSSLCKVFDSFSIHAHDAVIITEDTRFVGIVTLKDMMLSMKDLDNMMRPVREFMTSPLVMFDATQSIADVLEGSPSKIVVKDNNKVIGIIDHSDLLSFCYSKITPLIKHEYNLLHSVLRLADEGNKALLKLATTDSLTGIGNRRLFEEVFHSHQAVVGKYHPTLHLLIFDVDDFKVINDTYGHTIGDSVLTELAALVSNSIRKSDVFVRWGGEEFAILLRYSDMNSVITMAEHLCSIIDSHRFESVGHMTCSFGLSEIQSAEKLSTVMDRADKALYRAKSDGKNCVRIASV
ncbi:diguanylate cyclase [Sulfuricurvum sp.]|uniref:diguanylate cyclase n=1 Tax=Sulfuricurvum sp. TaxID=2025608 RepID=UPI002E36C32F|nr:diguanylate cyclase [Sulfuricurvum sp.]